jgi:hypothetical protein
MSMTGSPPDSWQKTRRRLQRRDARQRLRSLATKPVTIVVIVVLVLGAAAGITLKLTSQGGTSQCQRAFIPAYFPASVWSQAVGTKPPPSAMILNPATGVGAGTAPNPGFQAAARQARDAGSVVLGYSSTADGLRPIGQVEADVRNYKAWYGVTGIFLDSVNGVSSELPYYEQLTSYIRKTIPGASIWLNPGIYPDQQYMSLANVMMVFEGTYAQYRAEQVPAWAHNFPATRFANTVYGAFTSAQANSTISLSRSRNTGYLYVTNLSGANPYNALPSYWSTAVAALATGCGGS